MTVATAVEELVWAHQEGPAEAQHRHGHFRAELQVNLGEGLWLGTIVLL